jgi:hypothetical protein
MGPLTLLPLLGIALAVSRTARVSSPAAFFLAVAFVILTLYVGALAGALWWTALAVHIGGVALLGLEAWRHTRQQAALAIPVPIGVLVLLCSWFWVVHGNDQYMLYDEFSHWGIFLRDMLAFDGLWTAETSSMHPRYPPGAPLWQYLFNAFLPASDGKAYFAHFVLMLAPLLALWNGVRWSQPIWIVAILALVLLAIANFGLGVSTLYVDQTIGVWYLGTVLAAIADDNLASRRVALYAAPLAVLALLKDAGLPFAASGAAILAALFCSRALESARPRSGLMKTGAALAVLLAPPLLCAQVWSWNRDSVGAPHEVYSMSGIVGGIADGASEANSEGNAEIARRLNEVFFDQQLSNGSATWEQNEFTYGMRDLFTDSYRLTTFGLLVAFALWWLLIAYRLLTPELRSSWLLVAGGVLLTAIAYIASLHLSYRFAFGERGLALPSYLRYVHVVALPLFLLSFCPLLPAFRRNEPDRVWRIREWAVPQRAALFAAAVVACYGLETPYLQRILEPNPQIQVRTALEPLLEDIRADVGTSRLWIYYPTDTGNGFNGRLVQFLLAPTPAVIERSPQFFENDAASVAASWKAFEYLWIASPLTPEAAAGLARFSAGNVTAPLYRVRSATSGDVTLEPLGHRGEAE